MSDSIQKVRLELHAALYAGADASKIRARLAKLEQAERDSQAATAESAAVASAAHQAKSQAAIAATAATLANQSRAWISAMLAPYVNNLSHGISPMNEHLDQLAESLATAQVRAEDAQNRLDEAQSVLSVLQVKHAEAIGRASAALDGVRAGSLSEEIGAMRHSLAQQDAEDLAGMINQASVQVHNLQSELVLSGNTVARAQEQLNHFKHAAFVDGLKEEILATEVRLLEMVYAAHRKNRELNNGFASVKEVWAPSQAFIDLAYGVSPRV